MIHLVHGIRQFKPGAHMAPLRQLLTADGLPVNTVDYGPVWLPTTNKTAVNAVVAAVRPGDTVVAYSNGGWAAQQALELGCPIDQLVLISPALNVLSEFAPQVQSVTVFHSQGDFATEAAKWYRRLTRLLPWRWRNPHGWGAMGNDGYLGNDPRVTNVDMGHKIGHRWYNYPEAVALIAARVKRVHNGL